jgi:hypothetical protein
MYASVQKWYFVDFFFFFSLWEVKNECIQNNPEGVREVVAEEKMST